MLERWHKKERPLQGLTGLAGGIQRGNAAGGGVEVSYEYFTNGNITIPVPGTVTMFKIAGVAAGSPGQNGPVSSTSGSAGGGGGAGNLSGYEAPIPSVAGQTIYVTNHGPARVQRGDNVDIWHAGQGSTSSGGVMLTGPGNSGGARGNPGGRQQAGGPGGNATNAGAGGGGGGGHGDGSGDPGRSGGGGGTVTISNAITPMGVGPASPWTITGTSGGPGGGSQSAGPQAPNGGATGGSQPGGWPSSANGGGGGGGGSVLIYNTAYGGGGGGFGANHPSGSGSGGSGRGGFVIIQMTVIE